MNKYIVSPETEAKLREFAMLVEANNLIQLQLESVDCQPNRDNAKTKFTVGQKYTRVDIGGSGRYMVVNDTGEIYGIKGYGVIHRGHYFGTLNTLSDWWWGTYRAMKIEEFVNCYGKRLIEINSPLVAPAAV